MPPEANMSVSLQYQQSHEVMLIGLLCVGSGCCFFYINSVLLHTLRTKQVFCETPRYILLFNLLFGDTVQLVSSFLLYLPAALRIRLAYSECGFLVLLTVLAASVSPLTLAVMSLERFVAVCFPLRYVIVFTVKSTGTAIALVWAFSFIHILIRVIMLLHVFSRNPPNLQMKDFCSKEAVFYAPIFNDFEEVFASTLFLSVGAAIAASYIGVSIVATSVSSNKESTRKALHTLLLHLIQLSLTLISTLFTTIIAAISTTVTRLVLVRIYNVCFVYLSILPRCLSALVYGLRDQTIRPVFMLNLCCGWRSSFFQK